MLWFFCDSCYLYRTVDELACGGHVAWVALAVVVFSLSTHAADQFRSAFVETLKKSNYG